MGERIQAGRQIQLYMVLHSSCSLGTKTKKSATDFILIFLRDTTKPNINIQSGLFQKFHSQGGSVTDDLRLCLWDGDCPGDTWTSLVGHVDKHKECVYVYVAQITSSR